MADLTADDVKRLVAEELAKTLAATRAEPRRFLEATFSGPARNRKRAVEAVEDAGYTAQTHDPIHDGDTGGWLTVEVDWTRDGQVDGDFQTHHLDKLRAALRPVGYELKTYGVAAGALTR